MNIQTVQRTNAIINRLAQILRPFIEQSLPIMLDAKGKIITTWEGNGTLTDRRKKGPGPFELIYRELPQTMRRDFICGNAPTAKPTKDEFAEFERRFLTTARKVINREITKRLDKLPDPVKKERGRPRRKQKRIKLVQKTVEVLTKKMGKVDAVREAARILGEGGTPLHPDTVWRYLRIGKTKPLAR